VGLAATLGPGALAPRALVVAATLNPLDLGQDVRPICLRSRRLTQVSLVRRCCKSQRDLGLRSCHAQATWVRCTFLAPSFLVLEGDVKPKLIIIIIIDFTIKIKSIFFFDSNNIYCKFNNIYNINNNI